MEDITLQDRIYTHGGTNGGLFIGYPGIRDGKAVLIYGRHGYSDYIEIESLCSQISEILTPYMTKE
ncbi:MAG: hypothetical protein NC089_12480 [Bacteroides sp.]|nr:hypothetical protein [Bacteroides sp.]MCM1550776.1 hypothetical protein [Clostridium sp.]